MKINSNTRISELIKANKESINVLASLAKPFERLKNPILRKVMASRVTIAEAAKMGGCIPEDILHSLEKIGFDTEHEKPAEMSQPEKPYWLQKATADNIEIFDVRPIIESGTDPLKEIIKKLREVTGGEILCIINSFIPTPLIRLLEKEKSVKSFVETINNNEFHTYFLKAGDNPTAKSSEDKIIMDDAGSFDETVKKFSERQFRKIDVRFMEMPGPMQTILSELKDLPEGHALYIVHKRVPVYLLEELADKDFEIHIHNINEGDVKMLIFKPAL